MTIAYFLVLITLGIYSYSQVDLNLTLLQAPWFLAFQNAMIQLGYFQRPLSTVIFLVLTSLLFYFYLRPPKSNIWFLVFTIAIIGVFSYPAFSHDIFNYIFDARIFAYHGANPYTSTALMFPDDTWTRFMNWTHRTYPYGPIFLPISVLVYSLGLNKFILTLVLFKLLMVGAYVGCVYVISKLTDKRGVLFFALNPLIIYEGAIAGHVDILMLFFALAAVYYKSYLLWLLSAGIKFITVLQFPKFPVKWLVILAYIGAVMQITSRELLPHYLIVPLGFTALTPGNKKLFWLGVALSLVFLLLRYPPFFYTGQWH